MWAKFRSKSHPYLSIFLIFFATVALLVGGVLVFGITSENDPVSVPSLTGTPLPSATTQLTVSGLKLGTVTRMYTSAPKDVVMRQSVPAGALVKSETAIDLVVSD